MADYPIPNWLGPQPQAAELYSRGLAIGSQMQQHRVETALAAQRMQQAGVQAQMEAELRSREIDVKQQIAQQEAAQTQQRFAIEADYKQMMLRQAQQKLMQDAQETQQRMGIDLFKANTDWQKAAAQFDAEQKIKEHIAANAPTLGLEKATKDAYMQYGAGLGRQLPQGMFKAPPESPTAFRVPIQGAPNGQTVDVVHGGTAIQAPPTGNGQVYSPGILQVPGAGGRDQYIHADTEYENKELDTRIAKIGDSPAWAKYIKNRSLMKDIPKRNRDMIEAQVATYDALVAQRKAEKLAFEAALPKGAASTNSNYDFEWTGSGLK